MTDVLRVEVADAGQDLVELQLGYILVEGFVVEVFQNLRKQGLSWINSLLDEFWDLSSRRVKEDLKKILRREISIALNFIIQDMY